MSFELVDKQLRNIEFKRIKQARKGFEEYMLEKLKEDVPDLDINNLKFVWDDIK